jgi:ATP-dependent Clp endopeptidase proteolytic subunit ClpP
VKTELDDIFSYGLDSKLRRIYWGNCLDPSNEDSNDFTDFTTEQAVRSLDRLVAENPSKPIELHMNSCGGDPYSMLKFYDAILNCPCQIKFFGSGRIQSSATWIMAICDERYLYPNTTVMIHDGTEYFEGTHTDAKIAMEEAKRLQDMLYDVYAANSRMPKSFWEDVCQRDLYLSAEETIKLGLADKIVEPKKRGNLRKLRSSQLKKTPAHADMEVLVHKLYSRVNRHNVPKLELNKHVKEESDPNVKIDEEVVVPKPMLTGVPGAGV